jgi:LysR family pca operon transcriptional activator
MDNEQFKRRVRLRHLDCFIAVAKTRNLGKAALQMRLTQPAISKTLNELEAILGVKLLARNRLGAKLTRDGDIFLTHSVAVIEALNAAKAAIGSEQGAQNEILQIGALPTVAPYLLPLVLADFQRRYPQAKVVVQTATNTTLLQMLKTGEVDFALARMSDPEMMVGLSFELLYVETLVLAVRPGHPLAGADNAALNEVISYPLIVSAKGTTPRHNTESYFQSNGVKLPANCIETLSVSLARQMTRQSDTVWITAAGAVRADFNDALLVKLPVTMMGTEEPVGLFRRSEGTLDNTALTCIGLLREAALAERGLH